MTSDVPGDFAAPGGVPDQDDVVQVEVLDDGGQVVGVVVEIVALPRLARGAMARNPWLATKLAEPSQASAVSGQPWLKTTGCPLPQSLKKISVPSEVVTVGMFLPLCWGG